MSGSGERILLVESDPDICDLIARQALRPMGYQVDVVNDASAAIKQAVQSPPDLIITNLNLPGLSGKDLLVALNSQGIGSVLLVLAREGQERDVIQAFRVGASDYLLWPARDAEVVAAVERALKNVREMRARQRLDQNLKETNQELQRRVRDLTAILAVGKAVLSITDQRALFDRIIEGAIQVSDASAGWLMLRNETTKEFLMAAQRNLPNGWAAKMNRSVDDGISSLVALSGETLVIHGEPLQRFKISALGGAAAVVPIKVQSQVIGLLIVVRKTGQAFQRVEQILLEAVADYASISLIHARLFRALEQTAEMARAGEKRQNAMLQSLRETVQTELKTASYPIELLLTEKKGALNPEQRQALETSRAALKRLSGEIEKTIPPLTLAIKPDGRG
ncbi:MAG: response regulator [Candidatus Villigracilaceae bacterium]